MLRRLGYPLRGQLRLGDDLRRVGDVALKYRRENARPDETPGADRSVTTGSPGIFRFELASSCR